MMRLGADERVVVVTSQDEKITRLWKRSLDGFQVLGTTSLEAGLALAQESKALGLLTNGSSPLLTPLLDNLPDNLLLIQCPFPTTRQNVPEPGILLEKPIARQELLAVVDQLQPPPQRVLIVDDDPEIVRLYRRILRARVPVQNCLEAYNGREALALLYKQPPDLVLLDLIMPEVDGQTVLARMSEDPRLATIPVILISGRGRDYADLQVVGPIQIHRQSGFAVGELGHLLAAILDASTEAWSVPVAKGPVHEGANAE
jgi:CheY-like chemotaxis protein